MTKAQVLGFAPESVLVTMHERPAHSANVYMPAGTVRASGSWAQEASEELLRRRPKLSKWSKRRVLEGAYEVELPVYLSAPTRVGSGEEIQIAIGGDADHWLAAQLGCTVRVRSAPGLRRLLGDRAPGTFEAWGGMSWVRPVGVLPDDAYTLDFLIEAREGETLLWTREVGFGVTVGGAEGVRSWQSARQPGEGTRTR